MSEKDEAAGLTPEELALRDGQARLLAKREYNAPLALEAGAGTGKTATLVARVVCWALGRGWRQAIEELSETSEGSDEDDVAVRALEGIVAITFTEAAAAEMADRCAAAFALIGRGKLPVGFKDVEGEDDWAYLCEESQGPGHWVKKEDVERRARALSEAQESLSTRTIHAFCRALLARHPLEAKLAPGFDVDADGTRTEGLVREVLEADLRDAWVEPVDEDVVALLTLGKGPPELEEALGTLFGSGARPADLRDDPLGSDKIEQLVEQTRAHHRALNVAGIQELDSAKLPKNSRTRAALASFKQSLSVAGGTGLDGEPLPTPGTAEELTEWLRQMLAPWKSANLECLRDWRQMHSKPDKQKTERKVLVGKTAEFARRATELHAWLKHLLRIDVPLLRSGRAVLGRLLADLDRRMARSGVATFEILLSATRELLIARPEICAEERRRMHMLLVDEFQDTDATQCAIVRSLALDGPLSERPSLFLVGDPKQSIYGWRRADLAAYERFLGEVIEEGGQRLPLAVNFRSYPAILAEVSRLIQPVMVRTENLQPEFQPLLPRPGHPDNPGDLPGDRSHVEHWLTRLEPTHDAKWNRKKAATADAMNECEARAIAADIVDLERLERATPRQDGESFTWSDIAILARSGTSLEHYLAALRDRGVPYEIRGDKNYYRRREVVDAIALVRAVLDPNDHLALVTLLRSPWVGVPDAAFGPLFSRDGQEHFAKLNGEDEEQLNAIAGFAKTLIPDPSDIPGMEDLGHFHLALVEAARALGQARKLFATQTAEHFVDGLRCLFLPEGISADRYQGAWRLPNLERFFRELTAALEEAEGDGHAVLRRLRVNLANRRDAAEARPLEASTDAVQVMTYHGSKGLDFDTVYLPQLHKGKGSPSAAPFAFERVEGRAVYSLFGAPTLDFHLVEERASSIEAAERVRLLYVATTRAKKRLVLLANWPTAATPKAWADASSFADLLPHREGKVDGLLTIRGYLDEGRESSHSYLEENTGILWRLVRRYAPGEHLGEVTGKEENKLVRVERITAEAATPPPLDELLETATHLTRLRHLAAQVSQRPWSTRASDEAHAAQAESRGDFSEVQETGASPESEVHPLRIRDAAMCAGTAVHAGLEGLPLDTPQAQAAERVHELAQEALAASDEPELHGEASQRLQATCEALAGGELLGRLLGSEYEVVARELPVLLAPEPDDVDGEEATGPIGFFSGSIDLVLREISSGKLVVVDYKSDHITPAEAATTAAQYGPQLRVYGRALELGLGLTEAPRLEAWFLSLDLAESVAN